MAWSAVVQGNSINREGMEVAKVGIEMNLLTIMRAPNLFFFASLVITAIVAFLSSDLLNRDKIELVDDTEKVQNLLNLGGDVLIPSGTYNIWPDSLTVRSDSRIEGEPGTVLLPIREKPLSRSNPSGLIVIRGKQNVRISNIEFRGTGTRSVAIKVLPGTDEPSKDIEIIGNRAINIGLVWVSPEDGFSFNKTGEAFRDWGHSGPVRQEQVAEDIRVFSNHVTGDAQFINGHFTGKKSSISAISLLYVQGAYVYNNTVDNFNFGIWAYGGASRTSDQSRLSKNPIMCSNIMIEGNRVTNTYGSIWGSRCSALNMIRNVVERNYDVAIDYEGSTDSLAAENIVIDSRGGALTALNGSKNIVFDGNRVRATPVGQITNVILIRDGNRNISYRNNIIRFVTNGSSKQDARGRVFLKETSDSIRSNDVISFEGNIFDGLQVESRSTGGITLKNNRFSLTRDDIELIRIPQEYLEMYGNQLNGAPILDNL